MISTGAENMPPRVVPRRALVQALASAGMLAACMRQGTEPQAPVQVVPGRPLPWINWAGNQSCRPAAILAPRSEDELASLLRAARGCVRAVGAGHSFSGLVPTDDTLVATDLLSGLHSHDPQTLQAEVHAGTRLRALGTLLDGIGQALPNMPDIDYLALGGAIASSAHATGMRFGSLSAYVSGLTLATPTGDIIDCDARRQPELFNAARVGLGALGIVTRVRLRNVAPFRLTEVNGIERTEDVLDDLADRIARHRHFEFLPLPYSDLCATVSTDPSRLQDHAMGDEDPEAALTLRRVFDTLARLPGGLALYDAALRALARVEASAVRCGPSHEVFPHVRMVRFREMEYSVAAQDCAACVREILAAIRRNSLPVCMPLEVRFVRGDDIWLSMFEGRDSCSISLHQYGDLDHTAYFGLVEPIFWKYGGRPHWGKLHTLDAPRLSALYPRHWQDFRAVRRAMDPGNRMLNAHLRTLLEA